jgi:iron uptake system component EfeO
MKTKPISVGSRAGVAALAVLATIGVCGCGGSSSGSSASETTPRILHVALTDKGCSPAKLSGPSGPLTLVVSNPGTSAVTEMELKTRQGIILGERESVPAHVSSKFSLNLNPGDYVMNCPNGEVETDNGVLSITGRPLAAQSVSDARILAVATTAYRTYVSRESIQLLVGTRKFVAALKRGDLTQAKLLFGPVRRHYEAIEPVAESFGKLDPTIDARVNEVPNVKNWTGFHRIEQILWTRNTTRGTGAYANKLLEAVEQLTEKVTTLEFQAPQLANGAVELLNEVATSKITGEEDRYSHTDLSDFEGNLTGARTAFELLRPALVKRGQTTLVSSISARFAAVQKGLDTYRRATPLGFAFYSQLTPADRLRFAQQVDALAEPLSTVAARVAG